MSEVNLERVAAVKGPFNMLLDKFNSLRLRNELKERGMEPKIKLQLIFILSQSLKHDKLSGS